MGKKSILLVEDDALVRRAAADALKRRKYEVLEASSYAEALPHLERPVDLALLDYALPQRDGVEILKLAREKNPALPAIIMTGYGAESVAIKALRAGANDYVKKPLSLGHLLRRIAELLGEEDGCGCQPETAKSREEFIPDWAAAYIEENHAGELSLDKLSALARMNRYRFCRMFKERHKCGFVAYLNRVRIKHSIELLKNPGLSISDVASVVGYGSIQHFERVFVKNQGISPRERRRLLMKEG